MQKLQSEKALEVLQQNGMQVTLEQAEIILEFLRNLAGITVTQYLNNESSNIVYQGKY